MRNSNAILLLLALVVVLACVRKSQTKLDSDIDATSIADVNRELLNEQIPTTTAAANSQAGRRPNVIYIQHESLSGSIMLNTKAGKANTPFFQGRMTNDPDFYVFEHHRTGSGSTADAMPALLTGCLPFKKKGLDISQGKGKAIGYEFSENGYATASFSSRILDDSINGGPRFGMLYDILVGGMDRVEDALGNPSIRIDNHSGSNDLQMLPLFEEWLTELDSQKEEGSPPKPFYAQYYNFNNHHPYLKPKGIENSNWWQRNFESSLKTTDKFIEGIFDILSRTGQLENTIIVGSSDHGEEFKKKWARTGSLTSNVLYTAAYIYYPRHLMPHKGMAETLRMNTKKLTQTLDMHPTIRSVLHGGSGPANVNYHNHPLADPNTAATEGCISGIDLATVEIPEDRVTIAINVATSSFKDITLWALSTKDASLYHRKAPYPMNQVGQYDRDHNYILQYGSCTKNQKALCLTEVDEEGKEYFRRAVVSMRDYGSSFVGEDVKRSKLVNYFVNVIGGESAIEASTKMSGWSAPSCDNILLFMPSVSVHATIENQLNSYVLAAMAATFMNLSLVILDVPKDSDGFKKFQFGCSRSLKKAPPGLSGIVKSPKWLSSNCAVPCQQSHSYSDWDGFRQSSVDGIPETTCANDDGGESNVFILGGDDIHELFERHLKDRMVRRPSPVAHDWASRLGASVVEAKIFSQLTGEEQVWDYLGALVARSDLLQFQPWILIDVGHFTKQSGLPNAAHVRKGKMLSDGKGLTYDAIQVQRGNELLSDPQAMQFVSSYWDAHGGYDSEKHNYVPIEHYLGGYLSQYKCSRKIHSVYIATSDKKNVEKEISILGSKAGKGKIKIGCTTFQFRYPPKRSEKGILPFIYPPKKDSKLSSCGARYSDTVTSIAQFIIFRSAGSFMGDVNSDMGRLVHTFRLKLSGKKNEGDHKPVFLSRTMVALGKFFHVL